MKTKLQFHRFAQVLLIYTLFVILWGAWVRISHSGDGCGASWPLCHGQIIPEAEHKKTWVEFSHRLTSGLFGLLVIYFYWRGRKFFDFQDPIRKALLATLIFTITEALLGAKLVLFGLVGANDSFFRLLVMGLHQVNSLLLTGSVALAAFYTSDLPQKIRSSFSTKTPTVFKQGGLWFLILFLVIAVTGALASLSTTLFPSASLLQGLTQDFAPDAHYLLRLRLSHPVLATLIGGGLALYFWLKSQEESSDLLRRAAVQVSLILVVGVIFGHITLFSLAPVWMKLVHLLLVHVIWITLLRWFVIRRQWRALSGQFVGFRETM